ncbi:MAG: AraC family transcriptional regulator [Bacteroidota bacterium]
MKLFQFDKLKHGKELLMDVGRFEETPNFFFEETPHSVDFYEIFFFEKANGSFQLDDQLIPLSDNLIVFASPYQRRSWKVKRSSIKGHFMIFANQFLELFFTDPLFVFRLQFFYNNQTPLYMPEDKHSREYHSHALSSMMWELKHLRDDSEDFLRAFLLLILAGNNRRYYELYGLAPERRSSQEAYLFKKLVEDKIRIYQKVEDYARELRISRITLNKFVKSQFGVTATQFIKKRLLTEVKRELLFTEQSISEIAYELNFSEASSLIRFFQTHENQSPSAFRNAYQNVKHFIKR